MFQKKINIFVSNKIFQSVKSESPSPSDKDKTVIQYEVTPIMSTYLLAAVIGEYDFIEDKDSDGVLIRVYTPLGKKEQGRFALEVVLMKYFFTHDLVNTFLCFSEQLS